MGMGMGVKNANEDRRVAVGRIKGRRSCESAMEKGSEGCAGGCCRFVLREKEVSFELGSRASHAHAPERVK